MRLVAQSGAATRTASAACKRHLGLVSKRLFTGRIACGNRTGPLRRSHSGSRYSVCSYLYLYGLYVLFRTNTAYLQVVPTVLCLSACSIIIAVCLHAL